MKLYFSVITFLIFIGYNGLCQSSAQNPKGGKPALVVGIVIDQMRYDFYHRYQSYFGSGGFRKLAEAGYVCENAMYNYMPTYTAPGHASIFTGTTPSVHGIIGNNWYDRQKRQMVYCTGDNRYRTVGAKGSAGRMSPVNMISNTIGDELRSASIYNSRVFGIALKDRGAILPAGHSANAAYWYDGGSGNFITSSFYMDTLPVWVSNFNKLELAAKYLSVSWDTLKNIVYRDALPDNNPYEKGFNGESFPVFPHVLPDLVKQNGGFDLLRSTPFGNTITKDFAIELIKNEKLGKGKFTDMLTLSFSSPDHIGHQFGPHSKEILDCYIKLDKDIAEILSFLDAWTQGNYVVFLTADHAAADVPSMLAKNKVPSGYHNAEALRDSIRIFLKKKYADSLLLSLSNFQVFLNLKLISSLKLDQNQIERDLVGIIERFPGVACAYRSVIFRESEFLTFPRYPMANGYHMKRSGEILYNLEPGWMEYANAGTTHGSPWPYDTHVPLFFFGKGIPKGVNAGKVEITDIVPTLCLLLKVNYPNGCTGKPIKELIKK
jgi:predicted AlkP superfamily pyrophosphatase or phosphodiesterase